MCFIRCSVPPEPDHLSWSVLATCVYFIVCVCVCLYIDFCIVRCLILTFVLIALFLLSSILRSVSHIYREARRVKLVPGNARDDSYIVLQMTIRFTDATLVEGVPKNVILTKELFK